MKNLFHFSRKLKNNLNLKKLYTTNEKWFTVNHADTTQITIEEIRNKDLMKMLSHCNYETTGPKSALMAHIYSKHTPENERPFHVHVMFVKEDTWQEQTYKNIYVKTTILL